MTYRIICKFEPRYKRADGGILSSRDAYSHPVQRRKGAWRVWTVWDVTDVTFPEQVLRIPGAVGVLSDTRRQPGTRVSPFTLLKLWQTARAFEHMEAEWDDYYRRTSRDDD